jgi:hypothetical protein
LLPKTVICEPDSVCGDNASVCGKERRYKSVMDIPFYGYVDPDIYKKRKQKTIVRIFSGKEKEQGTQRKEETTMDEKDRMEPGKKVKLEIVIHRSQSLDLGKMACYPGASNIASFRDCLVAKKGEKVAVLCGRYHYRGILAQVYSDCLVLDMATSVSTSGESTSDIPDQEDPECSPIIIRFEFIETVHQPLWVNAPLPGEEGYSGNKKYNFVLNKT